MSTRPVNFEQEMATLGPSRIVPAAVLILRPAESVQIGPPVADVIKQVKQEAQSSAPASAEAVSADPIAEPPVLTFVSVTILEAPVEPSKPKLPDWAPSLESMVCKPIKTPYGNSGEKEELCVCFPGFDSGKYGVLCKRKLGLFKREADYIKVTVYENGKPVDVWVEKDDLRKRFCNPVDFRKFYASLPSEERYKFLAAFAEMSPKGPVKGYDLDRLHKCMEYSHNDELSLAQWTHWSKIYDSQHVWLSNPREWEQHLVYDCRGRALVTIEEAISRQLAREKRVDLESIHFKRNERGGELRIWVRPIDDAHATKGLNPLLCSPEVLANWDQGDAGLQKEMSKKEAREWLTGVILWKIFNPKCPLPWEISDEQLDRQIKGKEVDREAYRREWMIERMNSPKFQFSPDVPEEIQQKLKSFFKREKRAQPWRISGAAERNL